MSDTGPNCGGSSNGDRDRFEAFSRRSVLAATGSALAASTFAGLASAQEGSGLVQTDLDEPLGTSSPGSPIAPTDGFADTEWTADGELTVVPVTNLEPDGEGSIGHAATRDIPTEGRIIVFEVGGVIDLEGSAFDPETSNMYIAGQTAPEPGITFIRGQVELDGSNIVLQHVRSRVGSVENPEDPEGDELPNDPGTEDPESDEYPGLAADSITVADESENVIVDHCTAAWGTDENLSSGDTASRVSFTNNLAAHGLASPPLRTHPEDDHSNGTLIGHDTQDVAILGNLYAHNNDRHPRLKGGTRSAVANNVVYNFDTAIRLGDDAEDTDPEFPTQASIVRNVFRPGDNTPLDSPIVGLNREDDVLEALVFLARNVTQGPLSMLPEDKDPRLVIANEPPVWPENFDLAEGTFGTVLQSAGATPARRVEYDAEVVQETRERTGQIIDSQAEVGGFPDYDPVTRALDVPSDGFAEWLAEYTRSAEV